MYPLTKPVRLSTNRVSVHTGLHPDLVRRFAALGLIECTADETGRLWFPPETVARIARIGNQEISASSLAERFGFTANRQWTPVGDLSGGERRRLQLLRLLMAEPNVLLLDEPTNDLDIDTLTALEDLLDSFPGTVLVVSHDRYFVDRVCDKVVALLGDGSLAELPGGKRLLKPG